MVFFPSRPLFLNPGPLLNNVVNISTWMPFCTSNKIYPKLNSLPLSLSCHFNKFNKCPNSINVTTIPQIAQDRNLIAMHDTSFLLYSRIMNHLSMLPLKHILNLQFSLSSYLKWSLCLNFCFLQIIPLKVSNTLLKRL